MKVVPIRKLTPDGRQLSLTIGKIYEVLGIEADYYRMLTDSDDRYAPDDPVLFEPECFKIVDPREPSFWVCSLGEDGERYCYPPEWAGRGFFEAYHDRKKAQRDCFWNELKRYYPETWAEKSPNQAL